MKSLQERVLDVFTQWQKTADEMRSQNQPLNDNCIGEMRKQVEAIFNGTEDTV